MEVKIEIPTDMNKLCRSCMNIASEMNSIFDITITDIHGHHTPVVNMLMACAAVNIKTDDGLPETICLPCVNQLSTAYYFKQRCEKTDLNLRQFLDTQCDEKPTDNFVVIGKDMLDLLIKPTGSDPCATTVLTITEPKKEIQELDTEYNLNALINIKGTLEGEYEIDSNKTIPNFFPSKSCIELPIEENLVDINEFDEIKPDVSTTKYGCRFCGKSFKLVPCLKAHMIVHHDTNSAWKFQEDREITRKSDHMKCGSCKKTYQSTSELKAHAKRCGKSELTCEKCEKTFRNVNSLHGHMQFHSKSMVVSPKQRFKCDICDESFTIRKSLQSHFKSHIKSDLECVGSKVKGEFVGEIYCSECTEKFSSSSDLDAHMLEHTSMNDSTFCGVCDKKFRTDLLLKQHLHKHGIQPFTCNVCDRGFDTKSDLDVHLKTHNDNTFSCAICQKLYTKRIDLQRHVLTHSNDEYTCETCKRIFTDLPEFESHKKRHKRPALLCSLCGQQFDMKSRLTVHMHKHNNERPFKCSVCDKNYTSKSVLRIHERIHLNSKPYVCSYCGYRCCQSGDLQAHVRTHTGEKPYICSFPGCGRRFTTSSQNKEHLRRHTGERNHVCKICSKKFSESKTLKVHMLTHMGLRPHKCEICGKAFRRKHHLAIHMKLHGQILTK